MAVALVSSAILDFLSFPQLPYLFCMMAAIAFVAGRAARARKPPPLILDRSR